ACSRSRSPPAPTLRSKRHASAFSACDAMTNTVVTEHQGPIGLVTLNRPERHNAFDDVLIGELTDALRAMEADESVRLVVLGGSGRSFCAGADLNWMKRMGGFSLDENRRDAM